jgi:hypothetical protein
VSVPSAGVRSNCGQNCGQPEAVADMLGRSSERRCGPLGTVRHTRRRSGGAELPAASMAGSLPVLPSPPQPSGKGSRRMVDTAWPGWSVNLARLLPYPSDGRSRRRGGRSSTRSSGTPGPTRAADYNLGQPGRAGPLVGRGSRVPDLSRSDSRERICLPPVREFLSDDRGDADNAHDGENRDGGLRRARR